MAPKGRDVGALVFGLIVCGGVGNGSSTVSAATVEDVGARAVAITATGGGAGVDAGGIDDAGDIVEIAVAVTGGGSVSVAFV